MRVWDITTCYNKVLCLEQRNIYFIILTLLVCQGNKVLDSQRYNVYKVWEHKINNYISFKKVIVYELNIFVFTNKAIYVYIGQYYDSCPKGCNSHLVPGLWK